MKKIKKLLISTALLPTLFPLVGCTSNPEPTKPNKPIQSGDDDKKDQKQQLQLNSDKFEYISETTQKEGFINLLEIMLNQTRDYAKELLVEFTAIEENKNFLENIKTQNSQLYELWLTFIQDKKFTEFLSGLLKNARQVLDQLNIGEMIANLNGYAARYTSNILTGLISSLKTEETKLQSMREFFDFYRETIFTQLNINTLLEIYNSLENKTTSSKITQFKEDIKLLINNYKKDTQELFKNWDFTTYKVLKQSIFEKSNKYFKKSDELLTLLNNDLQTEYLAIIQKTSPHFSLLVNNIFNRPHGYDSPNKFFETIDNENIRGRAIAKIESEKGNPQTWDDIVYNDADKQKINEAFEKSKNSIATQYDNDLVAKDFLQITYSDNSANHILPLTLYSRDQTSNSFPLIDNEFEEDRKQTKVSSLIPANINHIIKIVLPVSLNISENSLSILNKLQLNYIPDWIPNLDNKRIPLFLYRYNNLTVSNLTREANKINIELGINSNKTNINQYIDYNARIANFVPKHSFVTPYISNPNGHLGNAEPLEANLNYDLYIGLSDEIYNELFAPRYKQLEELAKTKPELDLVAEKHKLFQEIIFEIK